jgi:protein-disulfide isomerase
MRSRLFLAVFGGLVLARGGTAFAQKDPPRSDVALIGDSPITEAELKDEIGNQMIALQNQEYQARTQFLEALIDRRLQEKEAASRGVSLADLQKAEIDAKVEPVTDDEVSKLKESAQAQLKGVPEAEVLNLVRQRLAEQKRAARRKAFFEELRAKVKVRVLLNPPRVNVEEGDNPTLGPKDAPVTVVEFSDFQCPYCARAAPLVKQLRDTYGDKVRVVFRDFPLVRIHKDAAKASEAAACAREQGKFWEMHDKLFSDQAHLGVPELKGSAKALGLDTGKFDACLDSGRHEETWKESAREGEHDGVSGTPFFFVNGRIVSGAVSFDSFKAVVDQELDRVTPQSPPPPPPPGKGKTP